MTNSKTIEPFCVDMHDATDDQIRELHQMCLDAGAEKYENVGEWLEDKNSYPYMGVNNNITTFAFCEPSEDSFNSNLIKFEDVPAHLGLTSKETQPKVGTLEHAYITLKGDLNNSLNGCLNSNLYVTYCDGTKLLEEGYYTSNKEPTSSSWYLVCSIKYFKAYTETQPEKILITPNSIASFYPDGKCNMRIGEALRNQLVSDKLVALVGKAGVQLTITADKFIVETDEGDYVASDQESLEKLLNLFVQLKTFSV